MYVFSTFKEYKSFLNKNCFEPEGYALSNITHAANVSFMMSHSLPTFLNEPIFMDLFQNKSQISNILKDAGDPKVVSVKNRVLTIDKFKRSVKSNLDNSKVSIVLNKMAKVLQLHGRKYAQSTPSDAFDSLPQSTSSSFPDYKKKSLVRSKVIRQCHYLLRNPQNLKYIANYPIAVNWRTQVSRTLKLKFRQFYPFPVIVSCLEKTLFSGIFKHFEKVKNTPYCYGNIFPDLSKRYELWQSHKYIYSLDIDSFDLNVNNDLISIILDFLVKFVPLNDNEIKVFEFIKYYHLNCYVVSKNENNKTVSFRKQRGLMSGSSLTSMLGSLINLFSIMYINEVEKLDLSLKGISVMGDDLIVCSNRNFKLDMFCRLFDSYFSQSVSNLKSEIFYPGQDVYFLGHYFNSNERKLNNERFKVQLCISENFISEDVMPLNERIISKFCSILFKCTDGSKIFDKYIDRLMSLIRLEQLPTFYYDLIDSENKSKMLSFEEYKQKGWLKC